MSSTAASMSKVAKLWAAPIGKKAAMALSGIILYGFVFVHMAGNLQYFLSPTALDEYGAKLRETPALLWGIRGVLVLALIVHVWAAISLSAQARAARPDRYRKPGSRDASIASKTMLWGGLLLLAYVVFHILHFTTGQAHPQFVEGAVTQNVITGLEVVPVAVFYIVAMIALAFHLYHGVWSGFQSLGLAHPKYTPKLKVFAKLFAFVVTVGFVVIPIAVLAGVGP
jgi:succinate dehydrogenase / fumarate reductase cytochrome b subunit